MNREQGHLSTVPVGIAERMEEFVYDDRPGLIALALRLDHIGGDIMAVKTIHELAELGLTVAIPRGFEPHRVENSSVSR